MVVELASTSIPEQDSEAWEACRQEIYTLLGGVTRRRGKTPYTEVYRSTKGEDFTKLNAYAAAVAASYAPQASWADEDTWAAIEEVVTAVNDDDVTQRGLLAAKIFLGYRSAPAEDDPVPMCDAARKKWTNGLTLAEIRKNEPDVPSTAPFNESIKVRQGFAAPMFSPTSTAPSTFRTDRPKIREVADQLMIALQGQISAKVTGSETPLDPQPRGQARDRSRWQHALAELRYFLSTPREDQFAPSQLTGQALVDRLEEKRLKIEYRARNISRDEYRSGIEALKKRRRARAGF